MNKILSALFSVFLAASVSFSVIAQSNTESDGGRGGRIDAESEKCVGVTESGKPSEQGQTPSPNDPIIRICCGEYRHERCGLENGGDDEPEPNELKNECTDSDGGKNYFEQGFVTTSNGQSNEDYCSSSTLLVEHYCEDGAIKEELYDCALYEGTKCDIGEEKIDQGRCTRPIPTHIEESLKRFQNLPDPIRGKVKEALEDGLIGFTGDWDETEEWSFGNVVTKEAAQFDEVNVVVEWLVEQGQNGDSVVGAWLRGMHGISNPWTTELPATKQFMGELGEIAGSDMEIIEAVYKKITDTVGTFSEDAVKDTQLTPFETMIETGVGVCRDRANLLDFSLRLKGIDSEIITAPKHQWVRVHTEHGIFDLDPTWYKEFMPLPQRN